MVAGRASELRSLLSSDQDSLLTRAPTPELKIKMECIVRERLIQGLRIARLKGRARKQ